MTILVAPYVGAKTCTDGPTVGNKNLTAWFLAAFVDKGATNLGIYNCRTVRGGTTTSVHGEGRASDLGTPTDDQVWSWELAEFLRLNSAELGIQLIIHNHPDGRRLIWSCSTGPDWRPYTGVDHNNHLHVELTWAAANGGLTVALLNETYGSANPGGVFMALNEAEQKELFERQQKIHALLDWYFVPDDDPKTPAVNEAAPNSKGEFGKHIREGRYASLDAVNRLNRVEAKLDALIARLAPPA